MIPKVSIICFAASYGVALLLELLRVFGSVKIHRMLIIAASIAGIAAHSMFIVLQANSGSAFSVWYFGSLILAGVLSVVFVLRIVNSRNSIAGLLLLPTSLALIAVAESFPRVTDSNDRTWAIIHGLSLLLGTMFVFLGFLTGCLYLLQSRRLKQKRPVSWIPSLEKLQLYNERSLIGSVIMLGIGLFSGIFINASAAHQPIPWKDPIVWASIIWLIWLISVVAFKIAYRPSRQGRKVAYLTIGSFLFLAIVLGILYFLPSQHTQTVMRSNRIELLAFGGFDGSRIRQSSDERLPEQLMSVSEFWRIRLEGKSWPILTPATGGER